MNQSSSKQIADVQTANLDALVGLANNAFEGFEKLLDLNMQTVKTALVETQEGAQKALSVKDTQELIAVETDLLRPMSDKALSYQRHLYKIAADTQAALDKVAEAQYEANKHEMTNLVKSAAEPWDSGTADAVLQAAIRATDLLFEGMRNAAKQMTQAAESSLKASADAVASASQPSDEQASQKAAP
ncbi:phasin family protein [Cupriavidus sp. DF5525]|uniref:phasin family protein n=1 Tax=Cupriavidus sp. DF5525 TaxID=3160989 RepID=UPI0032DF27E4